MSIGGLLGQLVGRREPADVVREFGPQVHRHLRRIFGPQADIDDVYQAVFVEILRSLPSFRGLSKMSTWIRRITWNVAYQEMRMQYRHQHLTPLEEQVIADPAEDTDQIVERRLAMKKLYLCLNQLDPRQRSAVLMHDIEGKTLRQISHELGRPLPTVASQLYTGRSRLTELMAQEGQGRGAESESVLVSVEGPGAGANGRQRSPS